MSNAQNNGRPATPTQQPIAPQTTGPIRVPPLTPDKISEYQTLFDRSGAKGGLLAGKLLASSCKAQEANIAL